MAQSEEQKLPEMIGPYEVLKSLGKGGMGEVFLVYDPSCERKIALKKILPELARYPIIKERFLREARFASKLSHPCIIPIHYIQEEGEVYYTMPYIEGETLKEIFKSTAEKEQKGDSPHEIGVSIPTLTRIFLSICQAIAYAYSKSILHRDLKPENIIVGKYGEVLLLDWGIATYIDSSSESQDAIEEAAIEMIEQAHLTRPGKVLGTVNFMAPERALKKPATILSEIYSLGVILYQILTLRLPFPRKDLNHFRKVMKFEQFILPEEVTPYRDIPKQLSRITQKCLAPDPEKRYQTIQELIFDLENYIEGKPEWMLTKELSVNQKDDWEFQENVLLSKHLAITKMSDVLEWVCLMISRKSFSGNLRLEFELKLPSDNEGVGILMCIPEPSERQGLEDGYCLWLGGSAYPHTLLFRSNAEIASASNEGIKSDASSHVCIEKIDNNVRVYIDGNLKLNYISHIPIVGAHIGFVYNNPDFEVSPIKVYTGSQSIMVNCLSVPDAFLASKHFEKAFLEYKRIAYSFQGRTEGREAQFRAGLTLLEQGKREKHAAKKEDLFSRALEEFEQLRTTPGAPLEYLGKSLVYYALHESEEELKCLELALRKYPKHPLLSILKEHIIFRLHESSKQDRTSAYHFALLCLRLTQEIFSTPAHLHLIEHLVKHSHPLPFINQKISFSEKSCEYLHYAIQLAFLLYKPLIVLEIIDSLPEHLPETKAMIINALFALLYMGHMEEVKEKLLEKHSLLTDLKDPPFYYEILLTALSTQDGYSSLHSFLSILKTPVSLHELRLFYYLIDQALEHHSPEEILPLIDQISHLVTEKKEEKSLNLLKLRCLFLSQDLESIKQLLDSFPSGDLQDPKSPLYFLYGCYLFCHTSEEAGLKHFSIASKDMFSYPHLLACHYITGNQPQREQHLLPWEKIEMYKRLEFFYSLLGKKRKALEFKKKIAKFLNL
jgi:serine/threonine-protein kinase